MGVEALDCSELFLQQMCSTANEALAADLGEGRGAVTLLVLPQGQPGLNYQ